MVKVVVFGGTFDPPTEGHVSLIRWFRQQYPDCILAMAPTTQNPWKDWSPAPQADRLEMIARVLDHEGLAYSRIDMSRNDHLVVPVNGGGIWLVNERYVLMADLIYLWFAELVKKRGLGSKLGLVVASDGAEGVKRWVHWDTIENRGLVELIVMKITEDVHATDVREGRHPLLPAIVGYVRTHLKDVYPNARG